MQETSREAVESLDSKTLEDLVFEYIKGCGLKGTTCDEAEVSLRLRHQTCSARFTALKKKEKIRDSHRRRLTRSGRRAIVWIMAEPDQQQGRLF